MSPEARDYCIKAAVVLESSRRWLDGELAFWAADNEGEDEDNWSSVHLTQGEVRKLLANLETASRFLDALGRGEVE